MVFTMIVYCRKTKQVYNTDLKFQQPLKDAWDNIVQKNQTLQPKPADDDRSRTPISK